MGQLFKRFTERHRRMENWVLGFDGADTDRRWLQAMSCMPQRTGQLSTCRNRRTKVDTSQGGDETGQLAEQPLGVDEGALIGGISTVVFWLRPDMIGRGSRVGRTPNGLHQEGGDLKKSVRVQG